MVLQVFNPFNQELVFETPYDTDEQIQQKVEKAQQSFLQWRDLSVDQRAILVKQGLEYFRVNAEEIARDITIEMGKPIKESRAEINTFFDRAEYLLSIASATLAPDILPEKKGFHRRIEHVPFGVVLDIVAWNYPLLLSVNAIVPGLLSGNTILLKHSAKTPLIGQHFQRAFDSTERTGLVTNLIISHEQTSRLIQIPEVKHVVFTGSVDGGRRVYQDVAQRFIEAGLELGGNDPAYVAADADLAFTAPNIVEGALYNAGQSCCAIERVYVHHTLYDELIDRIQPILKEYRPDNPMSDQTNLGPLASRGALDFLERQVAEAVRKGASLNMGGTRLEGQANFFPPTLLLNVPHETEVMQEESFGPLLPIQKVMDDEEALMYMNDSTYGLTASIWTTDQQRAEHFARYLETGTIYQNRCDYCDPALPWTGVGNSGKSSCLSKYGFHYMTRLKSIHFRSL